MGEATPVTATALTEVRSAVTATTMEARLAAISASLNKSLALLASAAQRFGVNEKKEQVATTASFATTTMPRFVQDPVREKPETKPSSRSFISMHRVVAAGDLTTEAVVTPSMPTRCSTAGLDFNSGHNHVVVAFPYRGNTLAEAMEPTEVSLDHTVQPFVTNKFDMPAPARCLTECRDVLPKQCAVNSSALAGTCIFTPVKKADILPATTQPSTLADIQKRCSGTERAEVPVTSIMVSSLRVPPRPPDKCCTLQEEGASLLPSAPLSVSRKEPRCSWLRPVPPRPPDQYKPGVLPVPSHPPEQTHGTNFASGQVTFGSQPRYERSANHYKLNDMVICWNVDLLIMPAPEANDVKGLEFSIHIFEFHYLLATRHSLVQNSKYFAGTMKIHYMNLLLDFIVREDSKSRILAIELCFQWDPGIIEHFLMEAIFAQLSRKSVDIHVLHIQGIKLCSYIVSGHTIGYSMHTLLMDSTVWVEGHGLVAGLGVVWENAYNGATYWSGVVQLTLCLKLAMLATLSMDTLQAWNRMVFSTVYHCWPLGSSDKERNNMSWYLQVQEESCKCSNFCSRIPVSNNVEYKHKQWDPGISQKDMVCFLRQYQQIRAPRL